MTKLWPNRRRRGFTLIEVMVVLVLVAVLSGVMIAEMAGTFEDALLRSTGREVISICALASSRSITLLQPHTVVIDPRENRYAIERPQLEKENRAGSRTLRDTHGGEGQFDPRIQIDIRNPRRAGTEEENASRGQSPPSPEAQPGAITFYPDGTADAREILLRDRTGVELTLRVNPVTSRVRVVESEQE